MSADQRGVMTGLWWNVALLVGSLVALPLDHRLILGLNPWIKPLKFELSVIIFLITISLLLKLLAESGEWAQTRFRLSWGFGVAMIAENSIIALQSARGVRSHMNESTPLDGLLFAAMGIFIMLNTVLLAMLLILFFRTKLRRPRAEIWGIRLGLTMILAGSLEGAGMVVHGAHTVGAADGGPGLPFLNWSTIHGDLRVPHFFALHALQFLWLAGWLLSRTRFPEKVTVPATFAAALLYAVIVCAMFVEAMAGRPLVV